MSRRNEIKKDLWKIFRSVYTQECDVPITDRQNELLDKFINYLSENYSLRRKGEKGKEAEEAENDATPLSRPEPQARPNYDFKSYKKLVRGSGELPQPPSEPKYVPPVPTKATGVVKDGPKKEKKTKTACANINLAALPPHLRKYVQS